MTVSPHPRPVLRRLTVVELRKLVDTRAGYGLLAAMALAIVTVMVVQLVVLPDEQQTFTNFFVPSVLPVAVLLPVLGLLSVSSEWSQRTALTTFVLVPRRHRVVLAKLTAVVLAAVASVPVGLATAALGTVLARVTGDGGAWTLDVSLLWQASAMQVANVLIGAAFGMLLLNSALAIVSYFLLPTVWSILSQLIPRLRRPAEWLDTSLTMEPMLESDMSGAQWGRLSVSLLVWLVVPLVAGLVRISRAEIV